MLSKKIFLSAAFISMAGFVACGDDSSSNSNSKELPPSVPTFFDLADVECNADRKCETIIVEEGPDTYECDGVSQWNMLINSMPSKICPAEEEQKGEEGTEEGSEEGGNGSDDNGNKSEGSEGSENTDDNGSSTEAGSSASSAESTSSNADSASSGEGSEGGEELTGPTGDLVSCTMEMFGEKTCDEVAKADEAALSAQCSMVGGTMKTDGGCKAGDFAATCTCKKGNHYDSSCDGFTCND